MNSNPLSKPMPIAMKQGGDDLEDDFVYDDIVALSGDEGSGVVAQLDDEDLFVVNGDDDVLEGEDNEGEDEGETMETPQTATDAAVAKKRKRREKEKERKAKKMKLAESSAAVEGSLAVQPPSELSAYLASMQTRSFPKLSSIELDDLRIPESSIVDTTQWTGPRIAEQLVDFIIKILPSLHTRLGQKSKANGAPTLLYVAGAALRVADLTRVLKNKRLQGDKGGEVAKLFAKHFKLAEHVAHLQQTKIGAAVGTPGRLGKLLNETEDALSVAQLSHIILDITYKDAKTRNLLDIPETRDEVFRTVLNGQVLKGIKEGKIQVVLF